MAVLVEAISVIIRADAIASRHPGGWPAFRDDVPNGTLCADEEIVRVGFMAPLDVEGYVQQLDKRGLRHFREGKTIDLVVIDQTRGPTTSCDWVEFGKIPMGGGNVAACKLSDSSLDTLVTPHGWNYEGSLSETYGFVPSGHENKSLRFLGHEGGLDIYLNLVTEKEVHAGRTSSQSPDGQAE
jgi:hypothetical protein